MAMAAALVYWRSFGGGLFPIQAAKALLRADLLATCDKNHGKLATNAYRLARSAKDVLLLRVFWAADSKTPLGSASPG